MVVELRASSRKVTSVLLLSSLTMLSAWLIARPWAASLSIPDIPNDPELLRAWRSHPANPAYQYQRLGRIRLYSVAFQDYQEALHQYRMALWHNPLSSRSWSDVARVQRWIGNSEETKQALRLALRLNPSEARLRWEAALLQIQLGSVDEAVENLKVLMSTDRSKRWGYFAVIRTLATPTDLFDAIMPSDRGVLSDYLDYLISHQEVNDARAVWERFARVSGPAIDPTLALSYADFMIAQKEIQEAQAAWIVALEGKGLADRAAPDNLVWNGGFEADVTLGAGFDWRVRSSPGVAVGIDALDSKEGKRSLRVSFDGTQNVDLSGITQVVRVRPDTRYVLGGHIKTRGMTTSNGIYLEASDLRDGTIYGKTAGLVGDHDWSWLSTAFLTPARTQALVISVRREASQKLDNLIRGIAWIDGISLMELH